MKKLFLTEIGIRFPRLVVSAVLLMTVGFAMQFPKVVFDNDPENMLSENEYVRVFHHEVQKKFSLYDFLVVGIVNESNSEGVFSPGTLGRIDRLTKELLSLSRSSAGKPIVIRDGKEFEPALHPESGFEKLLNIAFNKDPEKLFTETGESAVIGREIISPSVVDSIKQAELGQLKIEYLMENVPATQEEANGLRDEALANPLYRGTLVSDDGRALAVYIPIVDKTYSHNVANLVRALTADWPAVDQVHITGLPVAEDTFGVEMLVQMATSAPMAFVVIFLLLLYFFRSLSLIIAPMVLAVVTVICTMGLLIGLGYKVHIMSSMIAIFLMPIAVADSVHVLSEFFDTYHRYGNREQTIRSLVGHLFMPMLYTSLTTVAGFASLGTTPIPPVQVFGLHVAFGVTLAWVLTMVFVPAYIMLFVPQKTLDGLMGKAEKVEAHETHAQQSVMGRFLARLGRLSIQHAKVIVSLSVVVFAISIYGVSRINVNDNPVKWFGKDHEIRVADRVLNQHFGGTYTAYFELTGVDDSGNCRCFSDLTPLNVVLNTAGEGYGKSELSKLRGMLKNLKTEAKLCSVGDCYENFLGTVAELDKSVLASWQSAEEALLGYDAEITGREELFKALESDSRIALDTAKQIESGITVEGDVVEQALAYVDSRLAQSLEERFRSVIGDLQAPLFKKPAMLAYVDGLEKHLESLSLVGKVSSSLDALKKANYELMYQGDATGLTGDALDEQIRKNELNYAIPASSQAIGQVYTQLEGMKKKDSLFHLVTRDYDGVNLWVQLKSGDNKDMLAVEESVAEYIKANKPPFAIKADWAGLTYINVVWQDKMVTGMSWSLAGSFVTVALMMIFLFRSLSFGVLSMVPLTLTIALIYGIIGLVGKDYDMPVAVLSALTLGLSVDFAIHFLERARELQKSLGDWSKVVEQMFGEPALAISRNAVTISVGFLPLLAAPLVPYKTVGFFIAAIMAVSWIATLVLLTAVLTVWPNLFWKNK
ncbi:MAG: MMPL family transporter [bacterium]|nr:MMPL family transporter [bacterium]